MAQVAWRCPFQEPAAGLAQARGHTEWQVFELCGANSAPTGQSAESGGGPVSLTRLRLLPEGPWARLA